MLSRIECSVQTTSPISVKLANGKFMPCDQVVHQLSWWCQGETFTTDMRVLELGAYDAILGIDWLKQFSPMVTDWENHCLAFSHNNKFITLRGVLAPPLESIKELPVEQLLKWYKGNEVWALAIVTTEEQLTQDTVPPEIQAVLHTFQDVFVTPSGLPPERQYDHAISLTPNVVPINTRPYRYSPAHKDEIEKQVKEMMEAGIIVRSMSPFASPVRLVQKKDGSWRFCVDYRRLNELIVKNLFPMPIIDELLDELAGAKIFSNFDLCVGYH
jgi:hypothetical protein